MRSPYRTAAEIPVVVTIIDAGSVPVHLEIRAKAAHLRELGFSDRAIARAIGVSDKTAAKSPRRTSTSSGHDAHHAQLQGRLTDRLRRSDGFGAV